MEVHTYCQVCVRYYKRFQLRFWLYNITHGILDLDSSTWQLTWTSALREFLYAKLVDIKLCYYSLIHALSLCQLVLQPDLFLFVHSHTHNWWHTSCSVCWTGTSHCTASESLLHRFGGVTWIGEPRFLAASVEALLQTSVAVSGFRLCRFWQVSWNRYWNLRVAHLPP